MEIRATDRENFIKKIEKHVKPIEDDYFTHLVNNIRVKPTADRQLYYLLYEDSGSVEVISSDNAETVYEKFKLKFLGGDES